MRALALVTLLLCSAPAFARAQVHMWLDKEGTLHVEDSPAPRARKAARPKAGTQRWWERRSDAPPDQIDQAAQLYNIPAELVRAVIAVESAGDASAVSSKGAQGLMQLMPGTATEMYVADPVDPAQNIFGGTRYLRYLANQFNGDMMLVVAAYNAGPEAVRRYKGVPPFEETRLYVRKVLLRYSELRRGQKRQKLAQAERAP